MYISGYYRGTVDFDPDPAGTCYLTSDYNGTVSSPFLLIINAAGNFQRVVSWPGMSMAFDHQGNIFISGSLSASTDFDPGSGTFILSPGYNLKGYLVKLTYSGELLWAKRTATSGAVAADAGGNVYRSGPYTGTVDFNDADDAQFDLTASGNEGSIFIQKMSNNGDFIWAKSTGAGAQINFDGLIVTRDGTLYLGGGIYGTNPVDLDPDPAKVYYFTPTGYATRFLCKLTPAGKLESVFSLETATALQVIQTHDINRILISSQFRESVNIDFNPWSSHVLTFQGNPETNSLKSNWFLAQYDKSTTVCPSGTLHVSKPAQLKFPAGCTQFNGSLTLTGSEITSLGGLAYLENITGDLIISSTGLENLTGLGALKSVGGTFEISSNSALTSLAGLASGAQAAAGGAARRTAMTSIQNLIIRDNPVLTDCAVKLVAEHLSEAASTSEIGNNGENGQCNTAAAIVEAWQNTLPVTLAAFRVTRGEKGTAELHWTTTSELNSSHFDVEHSPDGQNWSRIGQEPSQGENPGLKIYTYIHTKPSPQLNYYRLKPVDLDGAFSYSRIQVLELREVVPSVYPNPVTDKLTIAPESLSLLTGVQLLNPAGIEVPVRLDKRQGFLDIGGLPAGVYLLRLSSANGTKEVIRIMVAR